MTRGLGPCPRRYGVGGRGAETITKRKGETERRWSLADTVSLGLLIRFEALSRRESDVESFLRSGLPMAQEEPKTTAWFGTSLEDEDTVRDAAAYGYRQWRRTEQSGKGSVPQ